MDVVVQPPQTAWAGHSLNGSIIVRLRTPYTNPDSATDDSNYNLAAVATLVPGSGSASTDLSALQQQLAGQRFSSLNSFADAAADGSIGSMEMEDPHGVGFYTFSELAIRQAGVYRIRITLMRIRNFSSDPPVASPAGGVVVQVVDSNPIVVHGGGHSTNMASNVAAYNGKYMVATY